MLNIFFIWILLPFCVKFYLMMYNALTRIGWYGWSLDELHLKLSEIYECDLEFKLIIVINERTKDFD